MRVYRLQRVNTVDTNSSTSLAYSSSMNVNRARSRSARFGNCIIRYSQPGSFAKSTLPGLVIAITQIAKPAKQVTEVDDGHQRPAALRVSNIVMKFDCLDKLGGDFPSLPKHSPGIAMRETQGCQLGFIKGNLFTSGFLESRAKFLRRNHGIDQNSDVVQQSRQISFFAVRISEDLREFPADQRDTQGMPPENRWLHDPAIGGGHLGKPG